MDEYFELCGQVFEWNRDKALKNRKDHQGISFESAATVFMDVNAVQFPDDKEFEEELREVLIGLSAEGTMLRVSFTERPPNIRIFSARHANKYDESRY